MNLPDSSELRPRLGFKARWAASRVTRWYLVVTLVATVAVAAAPGVAPALGLLVPQAFRVTRLHTLLTYAFVHSGIGHWALNALWIALLGFILEPRLSKARYLILLASGIVAGALGVAVLYSTTYLLIGDASVIYALAGASAAFAWRRRPTLSKAEIVLIALVTLIAFMPPSFFYANGLAWFLGAAFGITAPPAMPDGLDSVRAA